MSVQEQAARIVMGLSDEQANALLLLLGQNTHEQVTHTQPARKPIDFGAYGRPTERGKNADAYMEEIRGNDRI